MTITALPTPPSRQDPSTFEEKADAFLGALPQFGEEANTLASEVNTNKNLVIQASNQVQQDRILTQTAASVVSSQQPVQNAVRAEQAAELAEVYASQAQAVSPDSPIRLNTSTVGSDFTVPSGYNACSAGPLTISDGVSVTVQSFANWSVV